MEVGYMGIIIAEPALIASFILTINTAFFLFKLLESWC